MEIRAARPDEYSRVGDLTVAAYRTLPVDHLFGGYDEEIRDVAGRAETAEILVAALADDVVGAVTFVTDPESPWLEWCEPGDVQFRLLAVDTAARGTGAGRALARHCVERARSLRRPLAIHTTPWMETARAMYERMGFERRPAHDKVVWTGRSDRPEGAAAVLHFPDAPAEAEGMRFLAYRLDVLAR